jgi:haloalkane dehalogenase
VHARVSAYDEWLAKSGSVPKLLLTFDGSPETPLVGADMIAWCKANIASLEVRNCGPARHVAPEDQPEAIGNSVAEWMARLQLVASVRSHL